jgi:hypothetical protein
MLSLIPSRLRLWLGLGHLISHNKVRVRVEIRVRVRVEIRVGAF